MVCREGSCCRSAGGLCVRLHRHWPPRAGLLRPAGIRERGASLTDSRQQVPLVTNAISLTASNCMPA